MVGRHRAAVGSEDQAAQQRHFTRRGSPGPRPGWLTEYGLSFVPEVVCDDGLMLARVTCSTDAPHPLFYIDPIRIN
jgi:hypothetical protein